ncbi:tetratricopeptide repeat protein [Pseudoroseomonas globiformis]|uniref:Tetratricopeptide repeat protein n=1 Tax=Teichococcus globiformis TaxID=2307229 RepID=A0ABV7G233_9PROT
MSDTPRVRVFDNGVTTATFIDAAALHGTLVVTFDPFTYLNPDGPGFGEAVLVASGYDVLAFQKRQENFYQELTREDVAAVLKPYQHRYRRLVFYGCSVGAYAVLYFGTDFEADILSISPRVSTHPIYVRELRLSARWAELHKHGSMADRPSRARQVALIYDPVLVNQPAAKADILFMEQEILPGFPGITIHALRHTGHPSASSLAETHQLRPLLSQFLEQGRMDFAPYQALRASSPTYMMNFSAWLLERGKARWAASLAQRAVDLAPQLANVHFQRSHTHLAFGEFDEARQAARLALNIEPHRHHERLRLLNAFEAAGDLDGMTGLISDALELPEAALVSTARCALAGRAAQMLDTAGRTEEALAFALRAVTLGGRPNHLLQQAAQLQLKLGYWEEALGVLDEAAGLRADAALTHRLRAKALVELSRTGDAQAALRRAATLDSGDWTLHLQMAELHAMNYEAQQARQILQNIVHDAPPSAALLLGVARVHLKLAEDRTALETLQQALRLAPEDMEVRLLLAVTQRGLGQTAAALKLVEQALALRPDHVSLRRLHHELREEAAAFS